MLPIIHYIGVVFSYEESLLLDRNHYELHGSCLLICGIALVGSLSFTGFPWIELGAY